MFKKLQEMKERAHLTNQQIADISRVPLSTVNRILSGQTDNPTYANVADIVKAMGGSMDELTADHTLSTEKFENAGDSEEMNASYIDKLINIYQQSLTHKDNVIKEKNSWIRTLFVCVMILVAIFVGIAIFDIFNPAIGYVRY